MSKELQAFSMLFLGVGIGSLNPIKSLLGWIVPVFIATSFFCIDLYLDYRKKDANLKNNAQEGEE